MTVSTQTLVDETDITISGHGPVAAAVIMLSLGVTDGTAVSHGMLSIGLWDGTNSRCKAFFAEHGQLATDTYHVHRNDMVACVLDGTGAIVRSATASAITNGIRLTWSGVPPTAWKISAAFFGGTAQQGFVGGQGGATTQGVTSNTSCPFMPDSIIGIGPGSGDTSAAAASAEMMIAFASRSSGTNGSLNWWDLDNQVTAVPELFVSTAEFGRDKSGSGGNVIVSYADNGFSMVNSIGDVNGPAFMFLALKHPGVRSWVGSIDSRTSTGVFTHTEPGIKLQGAMFALSGATALETKATDDSASAVGLSMIGTTSGAVTERFCIAREQDATTSSTSTGSLTAAKVVRMLTGSGASMFVGNWDTAWPPIGISINWTGANATARKQIMLAFGAEGVSPPYPKRRAHKLLIGR